MRSALLSLLLAGTASVSLATIDRAWAQAPATAGATLDIPAQPLASALITFSRQTGIAVAAPSSLAAGRRATAVRGALPPQAALQRLLAGTGLSYSFTGPRAVTITSAAAVPRAGAAVAAPDGAMVLDTIDVAGGSIARGGVSEIVVGPRDLERNNPSDVRGVFAGDPRIKVGSSIPASQKIYVNGIEETSLAVQIDGSRQNNKVFHHNGTTLIDPSLLKAARVDAGVAPADAGPGALAGAIAYETKDARDFLVGDGLGGMAKSTFNTNGRTFTTSVTGYGRSNGFETLGSFNIGRGGKFENGDGQEVAGTATNIESGLGKIAYEAPSGDRVQLSHERVHDDAVRPFRANVGFITGRPAFEPRVRSYRLDRQNTVFTYTDTTPTGWWDPKLVVAYSATDVQLPTFLRPPAGRTDPITYRSAGTTDSFNGKFENRFAFGLGNVTAGVDFYRDQARYADRDYTTRERASNVGLYAQARLQPTDRTRLSFGLRGDRQTFTGVDGSDFDNAGLSRNISGEFDLIPQVLTAKAGYAHVWGGVALAENFIMNPAWRYGVSGPEPVTSDNVIAGLVARFNGFTVEGSVFRTEIDNARQAAFALATALRTRDVKSKGYEMSVSYAWEDSLVRAKYADIDVTIDGLPADSDTGTYLATPFGQTITLSGYHTFRQWGVTVGADLEIVLDYDRVPVGSAPLDGYEVFNAFVEYKPESLNNLTFRAEVKNLFDRTYADRATYGQEFGTVTPLFQPGRAFVLSAAAKF